LLYIEFAGSTETHTALFGGFPANSNSFADQISLELCDAGENRHNYLPSLSGRVGPRLRKGLEFTARVMNRLHRAEQITRGPGQPVQLPDNDRVAWANFIQHALKFGPPPTGAGKLFPENLGATRSLKGL
jgi:hypothetical protein